MGRTLFLYLFKDLVRYFFLAAVALAAIMSFGGLLRPLTKQGLDVSQVGWMLTYLMPAMATYSLPIAALFATTMVYGRLSADNELTAARASGISYFAVASPALLLGLMVAFISLLFLCFIVPFFTLQVERVLYSNIAQLVANKIDRNHEVTFENVTIYADDARVLPSPEDDRNLQIVELTGPTVVTIESTPGDLFLRKPKDFMTARLATAFIRENPGGQATLEVQLRDGTSFPRDLAGGSQVSIGVTSFGPVPIPSAIRENTKFMDINQLKNVLANPLLSREISEIRQEGVRQAQTNAYVSSILARLNGGNRSYTFDTGSERTTIRAGDEPAEVRGKYLVVPFPEDAARRPIGFVELAGGPRVGAADVPLQQATAGEIRISVRPSASGDAFDVNLELRDAVLMSGTPEPGIAPVERSMLPRAFRVPMPPAVAAINTPAKSTELADHFSRRLARLMNDLRAEIHARLSFALSCIVLVMVGAALGVLFRSGNFLSAFAVSVIPAVLCVALIVTGQHAAENVAKDITKAPDALRLGLTLIYSGNVAIFVLALVLTLRLQRK
jgi:lipopolysaccharide export LptBFGC system permease protein LptF